MIFPVNPPKSPYLFTSDKKPDFSRFNLPSFYLPFNSTSKSPLFQQINLCGKIQSNTQGSDKKNPKIAKFFTIP